MSSSEVVSGIFFTRNKLFWMEELSVGSGSDFINDGWFKIKENRSWDVFTGTGFREKGVESIITSSNGFVRWHLSVRLDTVFKTEEFPTGVTDLDTTLSNVNTNTFSHFLVVLKRI
jgi:hypothetical protein